MPRRNPDSGNGPLGCLPIASDGDARGSATSRVLAALLALQGVSGLAGGLGLVSDPSGGAVGLWRARSCPANGALLVGLALLTWIGVQILVVGYRAEPPLQAAYGLPGGSIAVLASLPSVRRSVGSHR